MNLAGKEKENRRRKPYDKNTTTFDQKGYPFIRYAKFT
jgi:hypothetical protein